MQTYILFFPRIGRNRELKKVLEGYWKATIFTVNGIVFIVFKYVIFVSLPLLHAAPIPLITSANKILSVIAFPPFFFSDTVLFKRKHG